MPTREEVRELLAAGMDYAAAGRELGIPSGQAYMIATGVPADGSDAIPDEVVAERGLLPSSQHLANPPHENPTTKESVLAWMKARAAADGPMRAAAGRRAAEPPEPSESEDDADDALSVLGRQHNQVNVLLKQLQALPSHTTGGSPEHVAARKSIVDMITVRLSAHETIEEEHFWPAVRKALPDGDQYADTALRQEREGKDTLTALGRLDAGTREFDEHVEQLVARLRQHVAFEDLVFLEMGQTLDREELVNLGRKLRSAMKTAPAAKGGGVRGA